MKINIGDKIVSDDYCAIGLLTKVDNKLVVVGDFGSIEYDDRNGDWEHYNVWKERIDRERKGRGGFWKRLLNTR